MTSDHRNDHNNDNYGVDVSFPIHHWLHPTAPHRKRYDEMINGCYKKYSERECVATERARLAMSKDQPPTQHNYTEVGFKKRRLPENIWNLVSKFYEDNKDNARLEVWGRGNTYTNHWDAPNYMVSVDDPSLKGGGLSLKQKIWNAVKPIIEEWTGHTLVPTSLYGVRIYTRGAILSPHVDRLPLVSSCIINVGQDIDEPWALEVYDHAGKAHNVTMEPGDMVLYESSTVLHGRPIPLNGNTYANMFVHFEPVDHNKMNAGDEVERTRLLRGGGYQHFGFQQDSADSPSSAGHEGSNHNDEQLEQHMMDIDRQTITGKLLDQNERYQPTQRRRKQGAPIPDKLVLNIACADGNLRDVKRIINSDRSHINEKDMNGWQPIHEAVRTGHEEIVQYLVENGADIEQRTTVGGTPLWYARKFLIPGHSVIKYLEAIGAPDEGPE